MNRDEMSFVKDRARREAAIAESAANLFRDLCAVIQINVENYQEHYRHRRVQPTIERQHDERLMVIRSGERSGGMPVNQFGVSVKLTEAAGREQVVATFEHGVRALTLYFDVTPEMEVVVFIQTGERVEIKEAAKRILTPVLFPEDKKVGRPRSDVVV
jgi:hypothetical protein